MVGVDLLLPFRWTTLRLLRRARTSLARAVARVVSTAAWVAVLHDCDISLVGDDGVLGCPIPIGEVR